jgi:uncharacterized protein (DUF885 family)
MNLPTSFLSLFFTLILFFIFPTNIHSHEQNIEIITTQFIKDFTALKIAEPTRDYREYFQKIKNIEDILQQKNVFRDYQQKLNSLDFKSLTKEEKYLFSHLTYEINLNLERVELELQFKKANEKPPLPEDGLFHLPNHELWYSFFIKQVTSKNITPQVVLQLGFREVRKVSNEIKKIQEQLGFKNQTKAFYQHLNNESFFIKDSQTVIAHFENIRELTYHHLGLVMEDTAIPLVGIQSVPTPTKDSPPGYYDSRDENFYFNFLGEHYNSRTMDWLFIHEAVAGHHYQMSVEKKIKAHSDLRDLFWYQGYSEGWGAYSEHLGHELGLYSDIYRSLGKWEWDLVRSARVVLDVGIHLKGWNKEKALAYWKKTVPNQENIAIREIDRIIRWPAQVLSYKVGEDEIFKLREWKQRSEGKNFDLRAFHSLILGHGTIPLETLAVIFNRP